MIRAQAQAAGARRKKGGTQARAPGRSSGSLGIKLHAVVDAPGLPANLILVPGHRGDVIYGNDLLKGLAPGHVIADKAYETEHFHDTILDGWRYPRHPASP